MREIEAEQKKKEFERKKQLEDEENKKMAEESNKAQGLADDEEIDREDAVRNALLQDVINDSKEAGFNLPPSVIKLLDNLKSMLFYY